MPFFSVKSNELILSKTSNNHADPLKITPKQELRVKFKVLQDKIEEEF